MQACASTNSGLRFQKTGLSFSNCRPVFFRCMRNYWALSVKNSCEHAFFELSLLCIVKKQMFRSKKKHFYFLFKENVYICTNSRAWVARDTLLFIF